MNSYFNRVDWKKHKFGLVLIMISFLLFSYTCMLMLDMDKQNEELEASILEQQGTNNSAAENKQVYDEYILEYQTLDEIGIVGNTQRLHWLETLEAISEKYALPQLKFSLENTVAATPLEDFYELSSLPYETTSLKLKFRLMHEGDFFNTFKYLNKHAQGIFSVESCILKEIKKEGESEGESEDAFDELVFPGVTGDCSLKWYTFPEISRSDGMEDEDYNE